MTDIIVTPYDAVHDVIECDESIAQELYDYFTFKVPNADMMRWRAGNRLNKWDGSIHLFQKKRHRLYTGLRTRLQKFATDRSYNVFCEQADYNFSRKEALEFIATLNLPADRTPRDYQVDYFVKAVRKTRALVLAPTSSGKSLIIYLLFRYFAKKTLIIVPTTGLVNQMMSDFVSYGYKGSASKIYAGQEKYNDSSLTVSTWQSIYEEEDYANQFGMIMVDEAHGAKAKALKGIMESAGEVELRYGFTGTLQETEVHRLVLEGLFGEIIHEITTRQLMDQGYASKLLVKVLVLKYPEEDCKAAKGLDYPGEIDFIVQHQKRRDFINNLTLSLEGNTIVLFRLVDKHGKVLFNDLKRLSHNPVYYIYGGVDADDREAIRQLLAKEEDADLVGSYGCVSTGLDAPSLQHVIFGSPYKSKIKVLQSIGRGLRLYKNTITTVYDIVDDLSMKNHKNFALRHSIERFRYYNEEKFDYKIYRLNLK